MNSLEEIAQLVYRCTNCELHQGRTNAVPGEGSPEAEVMFIGEGPGAQEDRQGRPFVGPAGQFLDELLASIGMNRGQVYIANMVKCRPPQNRDPLPAEVRACGAYLDRQIELLDPSLIVTLGRFSLARFFPGESISRARGRVREKDGRRIFSDYASRCGPLSSRDARLDHGGLPAHSGNTGAGAAAAPGRRDYPGRRDASTRTAFTFLTSKLQDFGTGLNHTLRVIPLGGLGEIGKNMMALECGDDIVVVDCGVQFPTEDMLGVDLIIPDVSYLVERSDRVRGILITHGHEDHIGALPHILPQLEVPVYAPKLAHGLIAVKLHERRATREMSAHPIEPDVDYAFGDNFSARWFRVCHSIPDAMGIALTTPLGTVIHTGDFKIDHTPVDGHTIDLTTLARYGEEGVLLLCSDSTYAEVPGYTPSEATLGDALDRAIGGAPGRVMVATFASLISRVQQVADAAVRHNRKLAIVGRSMADNVSMASEMGYLNIPDGTLVSLGEIRSYPPSK